MHTLSRNKLDLELRATDKDLKSHCKTIYRTIYCNILFHYLCMSLCMSVRVGRLGSSNFFLSILFAISLFLLFFLIYVRHFELLSLYEKCHINKD